MTTKYQSLISTMNADVISLCKAMNLKTDAIVINQTDDHYYKEYDFDGLHIREYAFKEKGVGLSRNNALMRSTADICIMSDDDMVYVDNYLDILDKAYRQFDDADAIIFNIRIYDSDGMYPKVKKSGQLSYFNCLRYGTASFTFKRKSVIKKNILFSLLFGGGSPYSSGEDSIFIWDCIKSGLKVYAYDEVIADVYNYDSTWFGGYTERFFKDKGALFTAISQRYAIPLIIQYAIRKKSFYDHDFNFVEVLKLMLEGRKEFLKLK